MSSNLTRSQIVDLLEYVGSDKIKNREGKDDIQVHQSFKKNEYKLLDNNTIIVYTNKGEFIISKEDEWIINFRCFSLHKNSIGNYYAQCKIYNKRVFLHNLLMKPLEGYEVDHKDGNTLNYTRDNLRLCTHTLNMQNTKCPKNNKLGIKGVSFIEKSQQYIARICVNKKSIFLGYCDTKEEAIDKREKAEIKYFGKYRRVSDSNGI